MRIFATALFILLVLSPLSIAQVTSTCELGEASVDLDYNDVRAALFNRGGLFYNGGSSQPPYYEVPRGSGVSSIFAAGIWVGGLIDGELRTAAALWGQSQNPHEYYPGPLDADGTPPSDCTPFDRIWKVNVDDVSAYEGTGLVTPDLLEWPVGLGAPVIDGDGVAGNYDLEAGDRPRIYGHETAFWVVNDAAGPHGTTQSEPIGVEVRTTAFAIADGGPYFDQATFYRYEVEYRGNGEGSPPLEDAYFTFWTDPDLGDWTDDYVGTDTTRGMGFVFNADNDDQGVFGKEGYGLNPPAIGVDFMSGLGSTINAYNNHGEIFALPDSAEDYYRYMQGEWLDGSPMTEGGEGLGQEGPITNFLYPGDPVEPSFWSMRCPEPDCAAAVTPSVRSFMVSTPAFTLQPGETETVDIAIVFARGDDHLDSITELRAASDLVQTAYHDGSLFNTRFPISSEVEASGPASVSINAVYPNPVRTEAQIAYSIRQAGLARLSIYDVLGREIEQLAEGVHSAGPHRAAFDGAGFPSGVYVVVLEAGGERQARKLLLVR